MMLKLSVVIPVHDEADNVAPLLAEVHAALKGHGEYEVIFVNDGSRDDTGERLKAAVRNDPRLRVLHHRQNYGQSAAMLTGVRAARAPWIVTLDGDGQNDPADIPKLLAARDAAGGDATPQLVTGRRRHRRDGWFRRLSSRVANAVRGRLLGDDTPDTGCGLKLFSRAAFLALPFFDHMHRFLPALIQRNGGRTVSVEVSHRPRMHGQSHYGLHNRLWVGLADLVGVMWLKRRAKVPIVVEESIVSLESLGIRARQRAPETVQNESEVSS
jgi:dolichol-phosphate mannosyltransferase